MINKTNSYDDYSFNSDGFLENGQKFNSIDNYIKKPKKYFIFFIASVFLIFFITITILALNANYSKPEPLTETNDFSKDYTNQEVINEYYS